MTDQQPDNDKVEQHINEVSGGTVIGQQTNIQQTIARVGAIIVILLVILAVLFFGVLPENNRRGILEGVGLLVTLTPTPSATPTATPTSTPLPTHTPAPTNTPMAGPTAVTEGDNREVLVLIAQFEQMSGNPLEPDREWELVLNEAIEQVRDRVNARVLRIPEIIHNHDEARELSEKYQATMVIWGNVRGAALQSNYTITPRWSKIYDEPDETQAQGTIDELSLFVSPGGDTLYVLNFIVGQLLYFDDQKEAALPFFEQAIEQVPEDNPNTPENEQQEMGLGAVYFYQGYIYKVIYQEYTSALNAYTLSLTIDPDGRLVKVAYNNRGNAYRNRGQAGDLELALADYNRALAIDPEYADAYNNRGIAYRNLGQYEQAIADYNRALAIDPDFATAYNNRGVAYDDLGQHEQAIADYTQSIELEPDNIDAYYNRGLAYDNLGEFELAITDYDKVIELNPDDAEAYNNRGWAYYSRNNPTDLAQAFADYDKAIELDPANAFAYNNRGIAYADRGELDLAIADFNRAIELNHDPLIWPYNNRGNAYRNRGQAGDLQRAIDDHDQAIQLDPQYANSHWGLGNVYYDLEHYEEALSSYRRYLELAGDNPSTFVVNRVRELEAQLGVTATPEGE